MSSVKGLSKSCLALVSLDGKSRAVAVRKSYDENGRLEEIAVQRPGCSWVHVKKPRWAQDAEKRGIAVADEAWASISMDGKVYEF